MFARKRPIEEIPEFGERQNTVDAGNGEQAFHDSDGSRVFRLSSTRFVWKMGIIKRTVLYAW